MALTRRQRQIYDFIHSFVRDHGYSPSLEEIGGHFGLSSVATVHKHVEHLVAKGYLRKAWNRSRSVEPVRGRRDATIPLPLLGSIPAGQPFEAIEVRETLEVPASLVPRRGHAFVLRVQGDSMIGEQIRDGDLVIVEQCDEAQDGDTVVALVRGEDATLKTLRRRGRKVRLMPANPAHKTIELPASEVQIQGVVRALLRQY